MKKKVFVFLFDGFSDWEIAYLTPEINKSEKHEMIYFSIDGNSVTSMGGLHVKPQYSHIEVHPSEVDMLILPGGEAWEKGENRELDKLVLDLNKSRKSIGAICAATTYLGKLGLLETVNHTSNDLNYLKAIAQNYKGEKYYQNAPAFTDSNIITASGLAPIEFAREVFKKIELFDDSTLAQWFVLFKN